MYVFCNSMIIIEWIIIKSENIGNGSIDKKFTNVRHIKRVVIIFFKSWTFRVLSCDVKWQFSICKYQSIIHCVKVTSQKMRKLSNNDQLHVFPGNMLYGNFLINFTCKIKTLSCIGAGNRHEWTLSSDTNTQKSRQY